MAFTFTLRINSTDYDISSYVITPSIQKKSSLFRDLKPNANMLSFELQRTNPYYDELLTATGDIKLTVLKDGSPFFAGYVSNTIKIEIVKHKGLDAIKLEAEDTGFRLLKKPLVSTNSVNTTLIDYKVCDKASTATSIVHILAGLAGITVSSNVPTISNTTVFKALDKDNKSYWDYLSELLFEYGYVFFTNASGQLELYGIAKSSITPSSYLSTTTNLYESLRAEKVYAKYDKAEVEWDEWQTRTNVEIFADTTDGDATNSCNIAVPANGYYPPTASGSSTNIIDYKLSGYDESIIAVITTTTDFVYDTGITVSYTNLGEKGKLLFTNTTGLVKNIRRIKIKASEVITQKSLNFTTSLTGTKVIKQKAKYIHSNTEAQALANTIAQYYQYANFGYSFKSTENIGLGSVVSIADPQFTGISQTIVLLESVERFTVSGSLPIEYYGVGIGVFNVSAPVVSSNQAVNGNNPINEVPTYQELQTGNLPIATNNATLSGGSMAGLSFNSSSIYTGTGQFNNANTPFYADNAGKFSLKDKLSWDGTNLNINGSGTFSGTVSATSGSFTGTITTSNLTATGGTVGGFTATATTLTGGSLVFANTGNITAGTTNNVIRISADDATYRLWIGNATAASAPFRVSSAGALTAISGTVGGFTLASTTITGGSLILTNTGNITAGTSNDVVRISANDATYRIWAGNATAASAPFSVSKTGALVATNATITGAITATSGSFTGSVYAGSGTIGGNIIDINGIKSTNYVAGTSGFTIQNTGFAEFNNINVRGNVNSTSGSVGGWLLTTDKLVSKATGGRIELNQSKSRISIFDSTGTEKVAMGYLSALAKNVGSGTWTDTDYGFWVSPGNSVVFDGTIEQKNSSFVATDSVIKIMAGATEAVRMGIDTAVNGLHLYHTNGKVSLYNDGSDQLRINTDSGYVKIGAQNTSYAHFYTDRANYYFDKSIQSAGGFLVYGTTYGIDSTGKGRFLSGTGADSNTVYIKDANGQLKERSLPTDAWTLNQPLLTTSTPTFSKVITSRLGLAGTYDSYQVQGFWSMGNAYVIDTANNHFGNLYGIAYAHTNAGTGVLGDTLKKPVAGEGHQLVFTNNGTANAMVSLSTGNFRTIGGFYGKVFPVNGTGADSNTVYIKDANGQLKERSLPTDAWTLNQPLLTTSSPTFAGIYKTGSSDNYVLLGGSGHKLLSHIVSYNGWVASPGYDANTLDNNISFTYANNAPFVGPILNLNPNGYGLQINSNYLNGNRISYRTRNGDAGTWNAWKELALIGSSPTFGNITGTYFIGTATNLQSGTANPAITPPTYNTDGSVYIQYQ